MEASTLTHASTRTGLLGRRSPLLKLQGDERLVALIRAGNDHAFEVLFERYHSRLLAFCRHMLRSAEDAEDVLQEVFVKAHAAMLADERPINVRPWLYRISRNRCLNHLRRPVPEGQDSMDVMVGEGGVTTAERVQKREDFRALVADVQDLPETQRTALLLREIDALSYEEIAETMDTTIPAVKSLLVRARVSLAEATQSRQLTCGEVQLELAEAAEGLRKASGPIRHHVKRCEQCREFRGELRSNAKALAALAPIGPLALLLKGLIAKLGWGGSGGAASGSAAGTGAGAGAGAAAGGSAVAGAGGAAAGTGAAAAGAGAGGAALGAGGAAVAGGGAGAAFGGAAAAGGLTSAIGAKAAATAATAVLVTAGAVEVRHITSSDPVDEARSHPAVVSTPPARGSGTAEAKTGGVSPAQDLHAEAKAPEVETTPAPSPVAKTPAEPAAETPPPAEEAAAPPAEVPATEEGVVGPAAGGSGEDTEETGASDSGTATAVLVTDPEPTTTVEPSTVTPPPPPPTEPQPPVTPPVDPPVDPPPPTDPDPAEPPPASGQDPAPIIP
jgi:RNA polymerase sigma factor (sigma-70 family)